MSKRINKTAIKSNLKIFPIQLKTTQLRKDLHTITKSGIKKDMSKIDDIIFRRGAHTQQDFRKLILNLTGSEPHPHLYPHPYPLSQQPFHEPYGQHSHNGIDDWKFA